MKHLCLELRATTNTDDYYFLWTPEMGWALHGPDGITGHVNYKFCTSCDWCGEALPFKDHVVIQDKYRQHRCKHLYEYECSQRRFGFDGPDTELTLEWNGFEWEFSMSSQYGATKKIVKSCPYCATPLLDPRTFPNKVVIE